MKFKNNLATIEKDSDDCVLPTTAQIAPGNCVKVYAKVDFKVYPQQGESINGTANGTANDPYKIFAGNMVIFECVAPGQWLTFTNNVPQIL